MHISKFSNQTGLSTHTLRYYEKIGLIRSVYREQSGHRQYSTKDIEWVAFICRLKQTNMPLKQIQEYAELRAQGDTTKRERCDLLTHHAQSLEQEIKMAQQHLEALQSKIDSYNAHLV